MNINYEGLVCYLNSNKNSKQNNVWLDSSGNNNNATLTSFSDNDFNGSYVQFNGNNYAVIPRCIQDDFTLSAEVILESSTSTAGPWQLWYNYASLIDAETAGVHNDFGLTISKDGHAYFGIGNPDRTIPYAQKSLFNEKHIITCTRKKDTGEYAMYIDGILIKKEIRPNKNSLTYPSEIYVGKGINNRFLSMKLFSIRIYNRVLDNFEIKQDSFFVKNKVYVNENNLPIIVDKLTDAKNIKISNNKYGNRVQTVVDKIVEKADDVTKAIKQEVINNSYSFKVGTGNVDVSADVEDGFGEVGIKGVTYQNLIIPNSMTKPNNVIIDGDIVTLLDSYNTFEGITYKALTKKNTTYTVVLDVKELFKDGIGYKIQINDGAYLYNEPLKPGINVIKIATKENGDNYHIAILKVSTAVGTMKFSKKILLLEGDHTNNPNLPSYFEGIVGIGDKSKNLFNYKLHDSIEYNGSYYTIVKERWKSNTVEYTVEPNTDYTISVDRCEGNLWLAFDVDGVQFNNNNYSEFSKVIRTNETGKLLLRAGANTSADIGHKFINLQLKKGTVATTYEPYHDGHKIEISSNGKNLYNIHNDITLTYGISKIEEGTITTNALVSYGTFGLVNSLHNINSRIFNKPTKIVKGKKYSISCKVRKVSGEGNLNYFAIFGFKKHENSYMRTGISHSNLSNINLSKDWLELKYSNVATDNFDTACPCFQVLNNADNLILEVKDIQIEEADASTLYEPYQEDKTQILLDEPLMRLPNGVCDEITRDGKLIRRVGKVVLDGSENWVGNNGSTTHFSYVGGMKTVNHLGYNKTLICSNIPTNGDTRSKDSIFTVSNRGFCVVLSSSKVDGTVSDLKKWLSNNPTTVYYELKEPVITELPAPYLRIFKDGHLTFNTLVAPESNHVVQLNKSGQIQNAIKESQSLDNRINVLENNYDNLMLSTISRLNDLELDYTLK